MGTVTFNLITEDPRSGELVVCLVENGPWNDDLDDCLEKLQARLYDAFDMVVDGLLASKYPESMGQQIRIQVDCYDSPPEKVLSFVRKFSAFIHESKEYQTAIKESAFITDIRVVNGSDLGGTSSHSEPSWWPNVLCRLVNRHRLLLGCAPGAPAFF